MGSLPFRENILSGMSWYSTSAVEEQQHMISSMPRNTSVGIVAGSSHQAKFLDGGIGDATE
jgi:hypothetical protein